MLHRVTTRSAGARDLAALRNIYNQGIEDRIATLDAEPKSLEDIGEWWRDHDERYSVLVAVKDGAVVGWASLNRFSNRIAHNAIADLSIYVERAHRNQGLGLLMMPLVEARARAGGFEKIVLHTHSDIGKRLYEKCGFRVVGVFKRHGKLDGSHIDVTAMEKLL